MMSRRKQRFAANSDSKNAIHFGHPRVVGTTTATSSSKLETTVISTNEDNDDYKTKASSYHIKNKAKVTGVKDVLVRPLQRVQ